MPDFSTCFWINGSPAGVIQPSDRGLAFGDGLFETIYLADGALQFWPYHLQRLKEGARRLLLTADTAGIEKQAWQFVRWLAEQGIVDGAVKLMVTRQQGSGRGYQADPGAQVNVLWQYRAFTRSSDSGGVVVRRCHMPISVNSHLAGLKHLSRLEQVMARSEWNDPAILDGLMFTDAGELIEGTMSNVFLVQNGELLTPPLAQAGVAGVMRRIVIERLAADCQIPVREKVLGHEDVLAADELALTNALIGVQPVSRYVTEQQDSAELLIYRQWQQWPVLNRLLRQLEAC